MPKDFKNSAARSPEGQSPAARISAEIISRLEAGTKPWVQPWRGSPVPLTTRLMPAKSNWKFILDTFYEGYHLAAMHQKTLSPNYRSDIHLY